MRKIVSVFVFTCFLFLFFAGVFTHLAYADKAADAKAMVEKAVAFLKANGKTKAFAEFTNQKGRFTKGELYIFVTDFNGMTLAHGGNPKLVGKDLSTLRDSDGKFFIKDMIEGAKTNGSGWSDYKWANPLTNTIGEKSTYYMKYNDVILACGIYKQ
jgi:signal transduction histidine kinase